MDESVGSHGPQSWWKQPRWWVVVAALGFALYFGAFNILRHLNLFSAHYDLGNMDQVLWQSLHGNWFHMMDARTAELIPRTMFHADFLLLIYLPFYALWQSPLVPAVLQAVFVATGALPLFWFGKRYLAGWAAALVSLLYLAYPTLHWAVAFDVHAVVLVAPLLLWAVWAGFEKRWWVYGVAVLLLVLAKEEVGVTVAVLGGVMAWYQRPRWIGLATLVFGLTWSALMLGVVIPGARDVPGHFALNYYSEFGTTPTEVVGGILTSPIEVGRHFFNDAGRDYLTKLLLPLGFTPLLGWPFALLTIPELLVNVLSNNDNLHSIYFHYASVVVPGMLLGAVLGLRRLQQLVRGRWWRQGLLIAWLLFFGWLGLDRWALVPYTGHHGDAVQSLKTNSYRAGVQAIRGLVQPDEAIAVTNNLGPHFTARDRVWAFPAHLEQAQSVAVLLGGDFNIVPPDGVVRALDELLASSEWQTVYHDRDLYYLRRIQPANSTDPE